MITDRNKNREIISSYVESRFKSYPKYIRKILICIVTHLPSRIYFIVKTSVLYAKDHQYLLKMYYKRPVSNGINQEKRCRKIIISLTTIPSRIEYVPYVLGSMMRQTLKPDMIILNLGDELFSNVTLPAVIDKFESAGVTVRYVPDLKPHTKYYYTLREYPEDIIITIDDDQIYPPNFIEKLYQSYLKHPNAISCYRAHLMQFDENGDLLSYNKWTKEYSEQINIPSMQLFATGIGGILYPPHCMHQEVLNKESLLTLSPIADDIWLKIMQVMNNCPVVVISPFKQLIGVASSKTQKDALWRSNVSLNKNDIQIQNVLNKYNKYFDDNDTLLRRMNQNLQDIH